jgi:integrase
MSEAPPRRERRRGLSDRQVAALPRGTRRYTVADPELRGHYVRVPPKGPNVFAAVARDPYGKQVWATLGSADVLKVDEARAKAREAIRRIKAGLAAFEPPPVKADSFLAIAESWVKRHVAATGLRSHAEIERALAKYVLPHWGDREFAGIRRSDVARLLDHIEDSHGARQADLVLAYVRKIANWHASRHDEYVSPFVRGMRRAQPVKRERILDDGELRAIWMATEANGTFGALVRMLLLTAQRAAKVAGMRWQDVKLDTGVWEIPSEAREKGNAGSLKLPQMALDIIKAQPRLAANDFVFAGRGDGHFVGFSRAKVAFDKRCGVMGWTLHDLRRTARSLMSRAGVRPDIAERALGHAIRGVEGVYDRHRYDDEKSQALAALAALVERILAGPQDNVVPLARETTS